VAAVEVLEQVEVVQVDIEQVLLYPLLLEPRTPLLSVLAVRLAYPTV
jgi:hypothetical protein